MLSNVALRSRKGNFKAQCNGHTSYYEILDFTQWLEMWIMNRKDVSKLENETERLRAWHYVIYLSNAISNAQRDCEKHNTSNAHQLFGKSRDDRKATARRLGWTLSLTLRLNPGQVDCQTLRMHELTAWCTNGFLTCQFGTVWRWKYFGFSKPNVPQDDSKQVFWFQDIHKMHLSKSSWAMHIKRIFY